MAENFTPGVVNNINGQTGAAVDTINANFAAIAAALADVLSITGVTPNSMQASLDMNGNRIINLPAGNATGQPVTYEQFITNTIPNTGVIGVLNASNMPALTGDLTGTNGSLSVTVSKVNGNSVTGVTGTGTVMVLSTSPTLVTPTLGVATATSINGLVINTTTGQLTISGSKILTVSNSLTLAGNDSTTITFQGSDTYVGRNTTDTLINKTIDSLLVTTVLNVTGGSINAAASTTADSSINLAPGVAPASPNDGDLWVTPAGLYSQVNGAIFNLTTPSATTATGPGYNIGFVNLLRNGSFQVWQRGRSAVNAVVGSTYTTDGWIMGVTGATVTTLSAAGFANSAEGLQIVGATSNTGVTMIQRIESFMAAPAKAKQLTFSCWINNNTGASITPQLAVVAPTASDNYTGTTTILAGTNLQVCSNSASTQVSYTFPVGAVNTAFGLQITLNLGNNFTANTKNVIVGECDLRITPGISTGLGQVFPIAEIRPIQVETAICQRYYQRQNSGTPNLMFSGNVTSASSYLALVNLPVTMRVTPTAVYGSASATNFAASAGTPTADPQCLRETRTATGTGAGLFTTFWTASAEL